MDWFLENRQDLARHISYWKSPSSTNIAVGCSLSPRASVSRVLTYLLDEREFLSPYGIRSMSRIHADDPISSGVVTRNIASTTCLGIVERLLRRQFQLAGTDLVPDEFPPDRGVERYHHFYGDTLRVECPTGSGRWMNLQEVACELLTPGSALSCPTSMGAAHVMGTIGVLPRPTLA